MGAPDTQLSTATRLSHEGFSMTQFSPADSQSAQPGSSQVSECPARLQQVSDHQRAEGAETSPRTADALLGSLCFILRGQGSFPSTEAAVSCLRTPPGCTILNSACCCGDHCVPVTQLSRGPFRLLGDRSRCRPLAATSNVHPRGHRLKQWILASAHQQQVPAH